MKMTLPRLKAKKLFIGILSGTSMNSIDAVLVDFSQIKFKIIEKFSLSFDKKLNQEILKVINSGVCSLSTLGRLDRQLGIEFSKAVNKLLYKSNYKPEHIIAIGSHGQNIWHAPNAPDQVSMQIGDPNIISAYTKILTVADFRRKDLALGGQGAPLAPALHAAIFRSSKKTRAIINIGGICNITVLPKDPNTQIIGFDIGPGNCLMDEWVQNNFQTKNFKINYDLDGKLAAKGKVIPELLEICLQDRYFHKSYPKSTGREYFNQTWLSKKIEAAALKLLSKNQNTKNVKLPKNISKLFSKQDLLATLLYLTAYAIKNQITALKIIEEIYICGGGAKNLYLLSLLKKIIPCPVSTTDDLGIEVDLVEAVLFAWLAKQTVECKSGNIVSVTGAKEAAILGGIYLP